MTKLFFICVIIMLISLGKVTVIQAAAETDEIDIIVEKNLFHPERKKWEMNRQEEVQVTKPAINKKELFKVQLYGTVLEGKNRYAVLRTTKGKAKEQNGVYMVGEYIGGYLIKEIERKKVVMADENTNENFIVFINEENKERFTSKTEIKQVDPPVTQTEEKVEKKKTDKTSKELVKKVRKPKKTKKAEFLKKRLNRHAKVLKTKDSEMVKKQALEDFQKIEKLLPHMSEEEQREVMELKNEIDRAGGG